MAPLPETLRRFPVLIAVLTLVGALAGFGLSRLVAPEYVASSRILVSVTGAHGPDDLASGSSYIMRQMPSYAAIAESPRILRPVAQKLGLGADQAADLNKMVVTVPAQTALLEFRATAPDAAAAARYADAAADQMAADMPDISGSASSQVKVSAISVGAAVTPTAPEKPNTMLFVLLGAVLGFVAGCASEWLRSDWGRSDALRREDVFASTASSALPAAGQRPIQSREASDAEA